MEWLNGEMLSLNMVKATNNNNDRIFYDKEQNKIELAHLGSRQQNLATARSKVEPSCQCPYEQL